jgi:tRNA (adenine22-N1)-methyltransferase
MSSLTNKIFPTRKIKLSDRLQVIQNAIVKKDSVIVDVGCDHCHTAISALDSRKAKFVFNIDNKKEPLINGIKNLTNAGFLSQAKNILADGLQTDQIDKKIDYCIISGLGGHKIAEIVKNKNADIQINEYIVVANDNPYFIRKFIYDN